MSTAPKNRASEPATLTELVALPEADRYELVAGALVPKEAATGRHGEAQASLIILLQGFRRGGGRGSGPGGWLFGTEVLTQFNESQVRRPDVAGWKRERLTAMPAAVPVTVIPTGHPRVPCPSIGTLSLAEAVVHPHTAKGWSRPKTVKAPRSSWEAGRNTQSHKKEAAPTPKERGRMVKRTPGSHVVAAVGRRVVGRSLLLRRLGEEVLVPLDFLPLCRPTTLAAIRARRLSEDVGVVSEGEPRHLPNLRDAIADHHEQTVATNARGARGRGNPATEEMVDHALSLLHGAHGEAGEL